MTDPGAAAARPTRPTPADAAIALDRVSKRYANGTLAIDDVSFRIEPGSFVSLLGPSGCGKSTVLRLIAGLSAVSAGTISGPGTQAGAGRPDLGFVFQEPTLMPWATVRENVFLPLRLAGPLAPGDADRVMAALEQVSLADFAEVYPRELSGGMRMRVSIARALVTRPRVLLMDEPFAALDEITRTRLNEDLQALFAAQRFTVLFVTHSVFESVYLSGRVLVMAPRPGRITADLTIDQPFPREAGFRTSPPYNAHCRAVSTALRDAMAQAPP